MFQTLAVLHKKAEQMVTAVVTVYGKRLQNSLQLTCIWPEDRSGCSSTLHKFPPSDPVPGACNLEFNLDIDPNIYIQYNLYETTIRFAPANLGYER